MIQALGLLIVFSTACLLLASPALAIDFPTDRRPLVRGAYERMVGWVWALSGSEEFMKSLDPAEREQFIKMGTRMVPHRVILGPAPKLTDAWTSNFDLPKLAFSTDPKEFMLEGEKIERTAKMDGRIVFNLRILNDPKVSFGLLEAAQLLFHEFGHLIPDNQGKDVAALSRLEAKFRDYLKKYHHEFQVSPDVRVTNITLPYLLHAGNPMDYQPGPLTILQVRGLHRELLSDPSNFVSPKIHSLSQGYQALTRQQLVPKVHSDDAGLVLEWRIESQNFLFENTRVNVLSLFSSLEKMRSQMAVPPVIETLSLYQKFSMIEMIGAMALGERPTETVALTKYAESVDIGRLEPFPKFHQEMKIMNGVLEGVIETKLKLEQVSIRAQFINSVPQLEAQIEPLTTNIYRIRAILPAEAHESGTLRLKGLILNGEERWDFEKPFEVALKQGARSAAPKLLALSTQRNGQWMTTAQMDPSAESVTDLSLQMKWNLNPSDIRHLENKWLRLQTVVKDGKTIASITRYETEMIPARKLQTQAHPGGGSLTSHRGGRMSKTLTTETLASGVQIQDSGLRRLMVVSVFGKDLQSSAFGGRDFPAGRFPTFLLTPPAPGVKPAPPVESARRAAPLCSKIF